MITALAATESARLAELEETIAAGLQTFVEVGVALAEIRTSRLYREHYRTFEDYVRDRWNISKPQATRLIQASNVVLTLEAVPMGTMPASERVARPLTSLPPEQQRETWKRAVETAPKDDAGKPKITAKHVAATVQASKPAPNGRVRQDRNPPVAQDHDGGDEPTQTTPAVQLRSADGSEVGQTIAKLIEAARLVNCIPESALEGLTLNETTARDLGKAVKQIQRILKLPRVAPASPEPSRPPTRKKKKAKPAAGTTDAVLAEISAGLTRVVFGA